MMAEGFWAEYLKDLFRFFPLVNDIQIRRSGRIEIHSIKSIRRLALRKIPEDLKIKHNIRRAFRHERKVVRLAKKGSKAGFELGFNTSEQALIGLDHVSKLQRLILKIRNKRKSFGKEADELEKRFAKDLQTGVFLGEQNERKLYLRLLGVVMNIAERKKVDATVMQNLIQLTKTKEDISYFANLAFRSESKTARRAVVRLGKEDKLIEKTIRRIGHGKVDENREVIILKAAFKRMINDLNIMFENTYKLWRRDFLAEIVLLRLLDETAKMEYRSIKEGTAPREETLKNIANTLKVKDMIAKHAHILAQGFRILIAKEQSVGRNAQKQEILAKREIALSRRRPETIKIGKAKLK